MTQLSTTTIKHLEILQEECGELIVAISKIKRFGLHGFNPEIENSPTNFQNLCLEIGDVLGMISMVVDSELKEEGMSLDMLLSLGDKKVEKLTKWERKNRKYWSGASIEHLEDNQIFVFGSNPEGRHGAGAARRAVAFGAKYGVGRGLQGKTYALVTKNLNPGYVEESTGIIYENEGFRSVSETYIKQNIDGLYFCAKKNPDKEFLICYKISSAGNLNGYSSNEMCDMFLRDDIPENIIFHQTYKPFVDKYVPK